MFLHTARFEKNGRVAGIARLASLLIAFALGLPACADHEEPPGGRTSAGLTFGSGIFGGDTYGSGDTGGSGSGSGSGSGRPCGDTDCNGYDDCSGQPSGCTNNLPCGDANCDGYDDCNSEPSTCIGCGDIDCDGYDDCSGQPSGCIHSCGDADCSGYDDCSGQPSGCTYEPPCGDADCDGYDDCSGQPSGCTYEPPCGDADCDGYDDCNGEASGCSGCGDGDCNGYDDCSGQPSGCTQSCGDTDCDGYDDCSGQPSEGTPSCEPPEMSLCELAHRKMFYCLASSGAPTSIDYTFATSFMSHLLGPSIAPGIQMRGDPVVLWQLQEATQNANMFVDDFLTLHAQHPSSPFPSTQDWQLPTDPNDMLFQRIASECVSLEQMGRWPTLQDWPNMVADITSSPTCSLFAEQLGDAYFNNAQRVEPMAQEVPEPEGPLAPPEPFPAPRHAVQ